MERVDGPCRGEPSPRKPLLIHCRHDATEPLTLVLPDSESFFEVPKKEKPVLLILGNPPYSGHSSNKGDWIRGLIDDYKQVDGQPLGEKNPKWLQDDYVKFLRYAQWKIEQAGRGVVGMITNHSYLDNPTFRGMRQSLLRAFDDLYVLDLHGNALKKETAPDGSADQNVFDIRQGVAVAFFVKRDMDGQDEQDESRGWVHHAERYGTREGKYDWLRAHDRDNTGWRALRPSSPHYLFVPRDEALEAAYNRFMPVPEVFPVHSVGIVTARDGLTIRWSADEVWNTVTVFSRMEPELARQGYELGKDARDWKVSMAQQDVRDSGPARERVTPILYRPFDVRHTYYTGRSRGFVCMPRPEVMRHMLAGDNLALIVPKQHKNEFGALATRCISAHKSVAAYDINYHFPLYIYPFGPEQASARQANLNPKLVAALTAAHGQAPAPEDVFHYVYAILHAPTYRAKYAEFLRTDFPRLPFTTNRAVFAHVAALGARLTALHLLDSPELDTPTCRFEGDGDAVVARTRSQGFRYDPDAQRLSINPTQSFGPVPPAVHAYRIGGYQVCDKWLKDRKTRRLALDDVRTYCRLVTAIGVTLGIQGEIDGLYSHAEEDVVVTSWASESSARTSRSAN